MFADPDGDGRVNLLEFGLGGRPLERELGSLVESAIEAVGDELYFTLTFRRPVHSELWYGIERSGDLLEWRSRPLIRVRASVDLEAQMETITVRDRQSLLGGGFHYRVKVAR